MVVLAGALYGAALLLAAPLLLAFLGGRIAQRSPTAAALACFVLLTANVSGFCLPGTAERADRQRLAQAEDRLLDLLVEKRIGALSGLPLGEGSLRSPSPASQSPYFSIRE